MIIRHRPAGSALNRAIDPKGAEWGQAEHLLAGVFDALQVANWQRGEAKMRNFPKPLERPGVEPERSLIGSAGIPMDEMARRLGWSEVTDE